MDNKLLDESSKSSEERKTNYYMQVGKMVIRFLSYDAKTAKGYLKTIYYDRPFYFSGLDHLLLLMEDIMDSVNYPQVTTKYRNINGELFSRQAQILSDFDEKSAISTFEENREVTGCLKNTVLTVQVFCRRNSSMQGELRIGTDKKVNFRSALELLRLIYEYLEQVDNML